MENIVKKPWGFENRWSITEKYLGKILHINAGHKLSRQYHEQKDESIYVLEGTLVLELGPKEEIETLVLEKGYSKRIRPNTIHRFSAPASGDCVLIEVSTPEIDDVVRIEDDYARK